MWKAVQSARTGDRLASRRTLPAALRLCTGRDARATHRAAHSTRRIPQESRAGLRRLKRSALHPDGAPSASYALRACSPSARQRHIRARHKRKVIGAPRSPESLPRAARFPRPLPRPRNVPACRALPTSPQAGAPAAARRWDARPRWCSNRRIAALRRGCSSHAADDTDTRAWHRQTSSARNLGSGGTAIPGEVFARESAMHAPSVLPLRIAREHLDDVVVQAVVKLLLQHPRKLLVLDLPRAKKEEILVDRRRFRLEPDSHLNAFGRRRCRKCKQRVLVLKKLFANLFGEIAHRASARLARSRCSSFQAA